MSSNLELAAEDAAAIYISYVGETDPVTLANAKEDYIAGYLDGAVHQEHVLEFVKKHLQQIIDMASTHDEFVSLSIAKYVQERLK